MEELNFDPNAGFSASSESKSLASFEKNTLRSVVEGVSMSPAEIPQQKLALAEHVERLDKIHNSVVGRLLMSKDAKDIVKAYKEKEKEAVMVLLDQRNTTFRMFAEASQIYSRRFIEKMLEVSGSSVESNTSVLVTEIKVKFLTKMEQLNKEFLDLYEAKVKDQENRPEELRAFIEGQKKKLLQNFYNDYMLLMDRLSEILRVRIS